MGSAECGTVVIRGTNEKKPPGLIAHCAVLEGHPGSCTEYVLPPLPTSVASLPLRQLFQGTGKELVHRVG